MQVDLLCDASNYFIVAGHGRRFPGVILQGDTIYSRYHGLREALSELTPDHAAHDGVAYGCEWFEWVLALYERTLRENGYTEIPYNPWEPIFPGSCSRVEEYVELPGWNFGVHEISPQGFRAIGRSDGGDFVEFKGEDADSQLERCRDAALARPRRRRPIMFNPEEYILEDAEAVAQAAARLFAARAAEAIAARGAFRVALSGGSTPERLFQILADEPHRSSIDWARVFLYWGDERCAKPDDPMSNYGAAHRELISRVPIPAANVFRMRGEANPAEAADEYEAALRASFAPAPGAAPRFDLVFLGVGPDGHTASLFPDTAALAETKRWVAANFVPKLQAWRITLTFPILNAAAEVAFLAVGEGKQPILKSILDGEPGVHPAQGVKPNDGRLVWLVDKAAAARLERV